MPTRFLQVLLVVLAISSAALPALAQSTWVTVGREYSGGDPWTFTSTSEGATWSGTVYPAADGELNGIATDGAGTWVAVGGDIDFPAAPWTFTSTNNGASWSFAVNPAATAGKLYGIATDGAGDWVAVGQDFTVPVRPYTFTSTNEGATWSGAVYPAAIRGFLKGIATDGTGTNWVAVGRRDTGVDTQPWTFTSTNNGATWSPAAYPVVTNGELNGIATDGVGTWIAVGREQNSFLPWTFTSTDNGATWSPAVHPAATAGELNGVATDGAGTWVAVGRDFNVGRPWTFTSTNNGATWSPAVHPATINGPLNGIATDGAGTWVAVGQDLTTFKPWTFTSTNNGTTWSGAVNPALNGILYGIAVESVPLAGCPNAGGTPQPLTVRRTALKFKPEADADRFKVTGTFSTATPFDPALTHTTYLTISDGEDDVIWASGPILPGGTTWAPSNPEKKKFVYRDKAATEIPGLKRLTIRERPRSSGTFKVTAVGTRANLLTSPPTAGTHQVMLEFSAPLCFAGTTTHCTKTPKRERCK